MAQLVNVYRLDSIPVHKAMFTEEGYMKDSPVLTSTGIFEYRNSNGSLRRELRLPEEVFDKKSLESYLGKPIIVSHDAGLITRKNVHDEQIGTILSEGYQDGDDVRADIIIHDTDEMRKSGFKELSLGYNLDLDETPGEWKGMHYDAIQRNIRINHLALVEEARAGDQARLNIDSRDSNTLKGGKVAMSKRIKTSRADSILSPEELEQAIKEYKARRAAKTDEDEPVEPVKTSEPMAQDEEEKAPETLEERVEAVKENRDRRDEDGDPEDKEAAMNTIAHQDEDIQTLLDIIDTLLAKQDFDKDAEEEEKPAPAEDPDQIDGDDEEEPIAQDADEEEEEPVAEDGDEEEEKPVAEDADEEEEEPVAQDGDEEEDPEAVDSDEEEENLDGENCEDFDCGCTGKRMDSIDRIVTEKLNVGMYGRMLGMKGLERMPIGKAKAKIIKAVRPNVRLDGKSQEYRRAMYDLAVEEIKKKNRKDTNYQRKQMFNKDSRTTVSKKSGQETAREKMIERMTNRV